MTYIDTYRQNYSFSYESAMILTTNIEDSPAAKRSGRGERGIYSAVWADFSIKGADDVLRVHYGQVISR